MKRTFFLISLIGLLVCNAQAQVNLPYGFNFQAVIRAASGSTLTNTQIKFTVRIRQGVGAQTIVWEEAHTITTNSHGQASFVVGKEDGPNGAPISYGGFSRLDALNWGAGFWIRVDAEQVLPGGNVNLGTISDAPLQAVPAAFLAGNGDFPGTLKMWAGPAEKVPPGWLICDGRQLDANAFDSKSGKKYDDLFQVIGTSWGGTGSTFRLPDFRGRFARGVTDVDSLDPDRSRRWALYPGGETGSKVGSYQADDFERHSHPRNDSTFLEVYLLKRFQGEIGKYDFTAPQENDTHWSAKSGTFSGVTGGYETRPKNVYVYYIIKL